MDNEDLFHCRVCGLRLTDPPWGYDNQTPLFEFCPCCGVEFGYQDSTLKGIREFREQWLKNGGKWDDESERIDNWNLEEQLKQLPEKYR